MGPEFLTYINARMALETPQTVLTWMFDDDLRVPFDDGSGLGVRWLWSNAYIRRSFDRYPEAYTDGDSILSEAYSASPSTSIADLTVTQMDNYYYSMFFKYYEPITTHVTLDEDIKRVGTTFSGIHPEDGYTTHLQFPLMYRANGVTNIGNPVVTSATALFWTDGIIAGNILRIANGGGDDGYYTILSVDSEVQVTLTVPLGITAVNVDFYVYTHHQKFWISGIGYEHHKTLWRWDSLTQLVDRKADLSAILEDGEYIQGIAYVGYFAAVNYALCVLTNRRYIRLIFDPTANRKWEYTEADIYRQWNLTNLTPGYAIGGCAFDPSIIGGVNAVYVLDAANRRVTKLLEATGALIASYDISPLNNSDSLRGLTLDFTLSHVFIGCNNYIYGFHLPLVSPVGQNQVVSVSHVRQNITADIGAYRNKLAPTTLYCALADDIICKLQTNDLIVEGSSVYLWQQPHVSDLYTIGLYHLDELIGNPQDSSPYANHSVNVGTTLAATGKFNKCAHVTAVGQYLNIIAISGEFVGLEETVSVWFAAESTVILNNPAPLNLTYIFTSANNYARIRVQSGNIIGEHRGGGAAATVITVAHPSIDTGWHHYALIWSKVGNAVTLVFDGVSIGVGAYNGDWAGAVATASIGDSAGASAVGYYDEVEISNIARIIQAKGQSYTTANRCWAFSGRDYTAPPTGPLEFPYRDEVFTSKFVGGEYLIRNDFERTQLYPPNKVIDDNEVIFRGPIPLPTLGDLGRLSRMVGLFLDRIADMRESFRDFFKPYDIDIESIYDAVHYLGLPGLDQENWNVDLQHRYLRLMPCILRKGGTEESYKDLIHLLGYEARGDHLIARRRWDSCVYNALYDARVPAILLDAMGSMDTFHETYPLALLRWRFYKPSTKATATLAGAGLLTDGAATFGTTAQVGNLIIVYKQAGYTALSYHIVTQVRSATVIKVTPNFTALGAGVMYRNYWETPMPDPLSEYLLERCDEDLSPDCCSTIHRDVMAP